MTTEQKFSCIFCKDDFDNKEELQIHFRKHADPTFKSKNRFDGDSQVTNEKVKDKSEMVSCDVCSQMFPTISKAITHKHKVHPDHDAKYFCPWCGKLFTMKHPYNIHIQTSHINEEQIENKIFHCESCDVDFFLPSAMMYHNKFFHRQDTDIPDVGTSKKLRLYNQEVLQLYYCAFCGEEYENKVNLFKHITDDHSDENQCPEDVLRCPLCEAIFYHLDAYEIHLSFHTTEDLYSVKNELFANLLDFSLETVPPMVEKVEGREEVETEPQAQDIDADSAPMGIEKFLELAMGQADDSNSGKPKKKKHKKSKKSAITLHEFLSMNEDVFGEGLDFQGAEEVPTRVVAKQLKNKKTANSAATAELEKLKQQGIVVMKVGATKPIKIAQKKVISTATKNRELKTSSEVLTKLINQSNNQIKIVKKTIPSTVKNDTGQILKTTAPEDDNECEQNANENEIHTKNGNEENTDIKNEEESEINNLPTQDVNSLASSKINEFSFTSSSVNMSNITNNKNATSLNETATKDDSSKKPTPNGNNNSEQSKPSVSNILPESKEDEGNLEINNKIDAHVDEDLLDQEASDSEIIDKEHVSDAEHIEGSARDDFQKSLDLKSTQCNVSPAITSLSTLKHLSHLTVKPVNQNKNTSPEATTDNVSEAKNDEQLLAKNDKDPLHLGDSADNEAKSAKTKVDKDPTLDALKILSKNITIKSLSTPTKRSISETESDDNIEDPVTPKLNSNLQLKDVGGNKNFTIKKIKVENNESALDKVTNNVINAVKNAQPNIISKINQSALETKSSNTSTDPAQSIPLKTNTDILKRLPNIISKPIPMKKIIPPQIVKQINTSIKTVETPHTEVEIIEISDIDESDDETVTNLKQPEIKQETTKLANPLKNLSKHIIVKSLNNPIQSVQKKIKVEKMEEEEDNELNHTFNSDDDISTNVKICSQKLSSKNIVVKNALMNLGKNITIKSRTSSPSPSVKSQDHNSQDSHDAATDSDTDTPKIKITELEGSHSDNDNKFDDDDNLDAEHGGNNPIVESPHDSCSDNDELGDQDFEEEIKASTVQKSTQEESTDKNALCLNNLKNISKSITIKSLTSNSVAKQEDSKPPQSQEGTEVVANQNKQLAIKLPKQVTKESPNEKSTLNRNLKKMGKVVDHTSNESYNQKVSVNKEVTVKTFQSKTVIEEITTTVTKTIKTVNQTVKQEMRNSSQMSIPVLPQKVQGMRPSTSKNLQGVVIRHAAPVALKSNNALSQIRPVGTVVRPSKQIVPIRPGLNVPRPATPRKPSVKNNLPKSSPNKQPIGKPLKFSPSVITSNIAKRSNTEEASGPFSCFKKPKESLIPVSDVPTFGSDSGDSMIQVSAASHTSTSNFTSTSQVVKGNSVVTATQIKSEVTSVQQLSRLNNTAVGIKVKCAEVKQTQVQEKSDSSAMKRTTLEAIERLQKQGLLVKKPRIDVNENSDSNHADDDVENNSADECDE